MIWKEKTEMQEEVHLPDFNNRFNTVSLICMLYYKESYNFAATFYNKLSIMKHYFLLFASSLALFLSSCGGDDEGPVDPGSVNLDKTSITLRFKETTRIKTTIVGNAQKKDYIWKTENDKIATVEAVSGGYGEVTARQVGDIKVTFISTDGTLSSSCNVTVEPRTTLLSSIFFEKGATVSVVKGRVSGNVTLNTEESTEASSSSKLVYDATPAGKITRYIYQFDQDNRLEHTIVVLDKGNKTALQKEAEEFIEERFSRIGSGTVSGDGVLYFDASDTKWGYTNTKVGVVLEESSVANKYGIELGVIFSSK